MTEPEPDLGARTRRFALLAGIVLWSEAVARAFWRPLTLIGGFVAIALFGVPTALPAFLHAILLIAFAIALGQLLRTAIRKFAVPAEGAALRRLERDSGLAHRPFDALADRPAADGGPGGGSLWRIYQQRMRREIGRLRLSFPQPDLADRDPWAIRVAVLIALVVGFVMAGPRAGTLILASLDPAFSASAAPIPLDAWIKPPAYTGLAPIVIKPGDPEDKPIAVPVGSTIEAHVTGGSRTPRLVLGGERQDFRRVDGGDFALSRILTTAGDLSIRRGWGTLARWKIQIIPDDPPTIAFAEPPSAMPSGSLKLDYQATDDYGVASVGLDVRLVPNRRRIIADPIAPVLTSGQNEKELRGTNFQDLTAHPWAGMPVIAKLVATDTAGQTASSAETTLTLPERNFTNQVARSIVANRKHVILNDAPRRDLANQIASIYTRPESIGNDLSVFLALRTADHEMRQTAPGDDQAVAEIEDLLWNAALKIEDGDRPEAEKALRAAEDALERALKDPNTPASEIQRLTQELKDAMNRDMDALADNLRKKLASGEQTPPPQSDENRQALDREDLQKQLDRMNQMAQNGSRQAAEDMLNELKSLLENMRSEMDQAQKPNEQGTKTLKDLKDMAQKQREMMNQEGSDSKAAQDQETLRQQLGDAMRSLDDSMGQIPQSLGGAERAMREATRALQRGTRGGARQQQEEAAGQLDQGIQSLSDQLSDQGKSDKKGEGKGGRDPFGRAKVDDGASVKVPTEREMQRSREILDELRRRSGERERPRYELDYIQRLLQSF